MLRYEDTSIMGYKAAYSYEALRSRHRRRTVFLTPQDFLDAAVDYFKWCEDHPLLEEQVFQYKGEIVRTEKNKVRPFTKKGLCSHLGIPEGRFATYRGRGEEWVEAVDLIEQTIYTQKFEHAAAGLLNASIIGRDLGLAEKSEVTGADGGPIQTQELSPRERIAGKLASLASRGGTNSDSSDAE